MVCQGVFWSTFADWSFSSPHLLSLIGKKISGKTNISVVGFKVLKESYRAFLLFLRVLVISTCHAGPEPVGPPGTRRNL